MCADGYAFVDTGAPDTILYAEALPEGMFPLCRPGKPCATRFVSERRATKGHARAATVSITADYCDKTVRDRVRVLERSRTPDPLAFHHGYFGVIGMRTLRKLRARVLPGRGVSCVRKDEKYAKPHDAIPCSKTPNEGICGWVKFCPPGTRDVRDPACLKVKALLDSGTMDTEIQDALADTRFPRYGQYRHAAPLRPGRAAATTATIALVADGCATKTNESALVVSDEGRTRLLDVQALIGRNYMIENRVRLDPWTNPPSFRCNAY